MSLAARLTAFAGAVGSDFKALFSGKVDKVEGKELSSNDFTSEDKGALDSLVLSVDQVKQKLIDLQNQIDELKAP